MFKIFNIITLVFFIFFTSNLYAAKVNCNFATGESYDVSTGAWKGQVDWESLWDLFGEGLDVDLDNSLLAKLDTQEIFLAGETEKGKVYLSGSEFGVEGRLSTVSGGEINVYSGFCTVGFG